jgi:hypothetical protein
MGIYGNPHSPITIANMGLLQRSSEKAVYGSEHRPRKVAI